MPKQLREQPPCPKELVYVWNWFLEISPGFSWTELNSWSNLTRNRLLPWEVDLLNELNNAYYGVANE